MSGRRAIRRLFRLGLWGPGVDEGVEWEIEHHIQERTDELEASGMARADAEREARRQFGDLGAVRREMRRVDRGQARRLAIGRWVGTVWSDIGFGLRGIVRRPGFAAALVLTLGLGIGATVAVFAVVDALLLRPLPFRDSEGLVQPTFVRDEGYGTPLVRGDLARQWRAADAVFDGMFAHRRSSWLYTGGREPRILTVQMVGPSFEEVLGVAPAAGRGIAPEDATPGSPLVAVLSDGFWRSEFGGDPDVLGRVVRLDSLAFTVIGIMPRGFKFPMYATTEFWIPLREGLSAHGRRGGHVQIVGRLGDEGLESAESRAEALVGRLYEARGRDAPMLELRTLESLRGRGDLGRAVWLLFAGVGLILLLAAVNGSSLLLVRGAVRAPELAVRAAMGASRGRMVRQLITESLTLTVLSGGVAIMVSLLVLRSIEGFLPDSLTFFLPHAIAIERRALLFAFALALGSGLVLGLFAALRSTRGHRAGARNRLRRQLATARGTNRLRRGLAVTEVALSVVLLTGAGLLLNSFIRLSLIDIGVRTENLAFVRLPLPPASENEPAPGAFLAPLEERVRGMPGVVSAMVSGSLPAGTLMFGPSLQAEGEEPSGDDPIMLPAAAVPPEFFEVMGAELIAGRPFRPGDSEAMAAIVDEDLARHLWPNGGAVGQQFRTGPQAPWRTVVGVMTDIQLEERDDRYGDFEILFPFDLEDAAGYVTVAFRAAGDPTALFPAVRTAIRELAPNQPILEMVPADEAYAEVIELPRFLAALTTGLAGFGLFLAAIGLFGVLAFDVARRRREMGVRMAIGAGERQVRTMVVRDGMGIAAAGAAVGLVAALALSRFVRSMLFGIEPTDPLTISLVLAALLAAAALASYLPARRATRVDPAEIMRAE